MSEALLIQVIATIGVAAPPLIYMALQMRKIHQLVNNNYGVALRLNAANSRWRADQSQKPEDIQAADQAQALLEQHEKNQAIVDSR